MEKNMTLTTIAYLLDSPSSSSSTSSSSSSYSAPSSFSEEEEMILLNEAIEMEFIDNFVEDIIEKYSDEEFYEKLRLSRETTNLVIGMFESILFGRSRVPAKTQIYIFLWFAANRSTNRQLASIFNVSKSTVQRTLGKVMNFFKEMSPRQFEELTGISEIIGCINECNTSLSEQANNPVEEDTSSNISYLKWSDEETEFIVNLYEINIGKIGPLKKFKTKNQMWDHIAEQASNEYLTTISAAQVESKFKTMMKRTKHEFGLKQDVNESADEAASYISTPTNSPVEEDNKTNNVNYCKWSYDQTKFLLNLYETNINNIGPLKKFKKKKQMWKYIAEQTSNAYLTSITAIQVESRYKSVMRRFKRGVGLKQDVVKPIDIGYGYISKPENHSVEEDLNSNNLTYFKWSDQQTKFVLNLYEININNIGPLKQFKNKKQMWEYIAKQASNKFLASISAIQVETKYKTVKRRTNASMQKHRTNEATKDEALCSSPLPPLSPVTASTPLSVSSLSPTLPSTSQFRFVDVNELEAPQRKSRKTTFERMAEQILQDKEVRAEEKKRLQKERHDEREANKQKRHEEKMALYEKKIALLAARNRSIDALLKRVQ